MLLLLFAHLTKARFENRAVELGSTHHLSGLVTSDHDSLCRLPDFSGRQGAPNQANDDLLAHQGAPGAALHAHQLRVTGLGAQHPVHAYRQFSGDRNLGYASTSAQLQSLIILS